MRLQHITALLLPAITLAITLDELNQQFRAKGVFVRQFDEEGGNATTQENNGWWKGKCTDMSDPVCRAVGSKNFVSSATVSHHYPYWYSSSVGGFVLSRDFVLPADKKDSPVNCACNTDCGSDNRGDNGCKKIDPTPTWPTVQEMLDNYKPGSCSDCDPTPNKYCLYPPNETEIDRAYCMYNEVVLDADKYTAALPGVIDAFFYMKPPPNCNYSASFKKGNDQRYHLPMNESVVREVYHNFTRDNPGREESTPLVAYDCVKRAFTDPAAQQGN